MVSKKDVTLSPRLITITRTKIITFKKNEETTTFYNDADGDANVDAGGNAAFCQCTAAPSLSEC